MKKLCYYVLLLLLFTSCNDGDELKMTMDSAETLNIEPEGMMVLGEKLNNPYSIANMQAALDEMSGTRSDMSLKTIEPNKLYVRFLPKDTSDINLLDHLDLELFDYPLDYDIVQEGDFYHDPSIPDSMPTWLYTTVDVGFVFPEMEYEILEECYIPEYGDSDDEMETRSANDNILNELEMVAIDNANLPTKYQITPETRALGFGTKPSGYITMDNDFTGESEPVKGVKVRCYFLVNISSAYTSSTGYYKIGHKYVCGPHYSIVYENTNDFTVWGNWACIAAAQHSLGYHSKSGHDKHINKEENEWKWAVINNAGYDYYEMCKKEGIKTPSSNLKIWCWPNASSSSAPMLRHLLGIQLPGYAYGLASILVKGTLTVTSAAISSAALLISSHLPDITIGMDYTANRNTRHEVKVTPNNHYEYHYGDVWHELSHASHFQYAGEAVWGPYINKILKFRK